jgi:hypothetical protein
MSRGISRAVRGRSGVPDELLSKLTCYHTTLNFRIIVKFVHNVSIPYMDLPIRFREEIFFKPLNHKDHHASLIATNNNHIAIDPLDHLRHLYLLDCLVQLTLQPRAQHVVQELALICGPLTPPLCQRINQLLAVL